MTHRTAVAVYARISQDRSGEELGVRRQLADCRVEAQRRGWAVAEEYVDDDLSAYSGKKRPAYERMLRGFRTSYVASSSQERPTAACG
ncbi:recombinase family protein [Actinotalea sp. JY-7885]|uniref:recombinase family protein n=1 Tax=Actinotalea sp. JY-7885 TaxID=2758576 RepID=UPI0021047E73|nr:recombinase family protein [Actinotalea sp. JY-7885]